MHDALSMNLLDGSRNPHPQVGPCAQVRPLLAARVGPIPLDPSCESNALKMLERKNNPCFVGEWRIGGENAFSTAKSTKYLSLPSCSLSNAVTLGIRRKRRDAIDPEYAL